MGKQTDQVIWTTGYGNKTITIIHRQYLSAASIASESVGGIRRIIAGTPTSIKFSEFSLDERRTRHLRLSELSTKVTVSPSLNVNCQKEIDVTLFTYIYYIWCYLNISP